MKRLFITAMLGVMTLSTTPAHAEGFTGDVRLACEAILCLSTGQRPGECSPSLSRYFGITAKTLSKILTKRRNFLNLCPAANVDGNMRSLVNAIVNGAGRCEAAALNASLRVWRNDDYSHNDGKPQTYIHNNLPPYCSAYGGNDYTDQTTTVTARYVGTPEREGFWVDAVNFNTALAQYNARIAAEDAVWGNRKHSGYGGK